jgi:hypothetical protein
VTEGTWLTRSSGPCGWTELDGQRYELDGWELFEGDPSSPHLCQGWFRCTAEGFAPRKDTALRLYLTDRDGVDRILDARIVRARTTDPEWEFHATP